MALAQATGDPTGIGSNTAGLIAKDAAGTCNLYAWDEAGDATLLTPHAFELFTPDPSYAQPWSYSSKNVYLGKQINVDMYGAIKAIEKLTGGKFIYEADLPREEIQNWDENQERIRLERIDARTIWEEQKAVYDAALLEHEALSPDEQEKAEKPENPGDQPGLYVKKDLPAWIAARMSKEIL